MRRCHRLNVSRGCVRCYREHGLFVQLWQKKEFLRLFTPLYPGSCTPLASSTPLCVVPGAGPILVPVPVLVYRMCVVRDTRTTMNTDISIRETRAAPRRTSILESVRASEIGAFFDPTQTSAENGTASVLSSTINLCNTLMGTGMLAMPTVSSNHVACFTARPP